MEIISSLSLVFLIGATTANTVLALLVYRDNPKSATNIIYGLLGANIVVWLIVNYASFAPALQSSSLLWIRLSLFFAMPLSLLFFLLANTIPDEEYRLGLGQSILLVLVTGAIMVVNMTDLAVQKIDMSSGLPSPVFGSGIAPFTIFSTLFSVLAVSSLNKKIRKNTGVEASRLKYVMLGILIMLGLIILTIFVPVLFGINAFVPFLPLYTLAFLGCTAYAIVKHQLFNVKVLGAEVLTVTIWIALLSRIATAETLATATTEVFVLILTIIFGILLIRGVRGEVKQREMLEVLTVKLREANGKLQELDKVKSEFLSFASHQVKTPTSIIKGYAELMLEGSYGKVPEKARETAQKIVDTSDRMIALLNNLLDLKKIEDGKMEFVFEKLDISEFTKTIVNELMPLADAKSLTLTFESEAQGIFVKADPQKLRQVIQNFTDNSIKYTQKGWVEVKVALATRQTMISSYHDRVGSSENITERRVLLSVSDSGMGISKELLPDLFKQFSRDPKTKRLIQGTGLGLYIAKQIVEAHEGKVWAESQGEGQGSTFYMSLPVL